MLKLTPTALVPEMTVVETVEVGIESGPHPLDTHFKNEIDENWASELSRNPALFDGETLMMTELEIHGARLIARCRRTRYATYVYSRRNGLDMNYGLYAHAVLVTSDNALLAGEMAARTLFAGDVYFASGGFEQDDFRNGLLDVEANMSREVKEETGFLLETLKRERAFRVRTFANGTLIAKRFDLGIGADEAKRRFSKFIASDPNPEITAPIVIDGPDFAHPRMAVQMPALIEWHFRDRPRFEEPVEPPHSLE
jgi:hypothetical protein